MRVPFGELDHVDGDVADVEKVAHRPAKWFFSSCAASARHDVHLLRAQREHAALPGARSLGRRRRDLAQGAVPRGDRPCGVASSTVAGSMLQLPMKSATKRFAGKP